MMETIVVMDEVCRQLEAHQQGKKRPYSNIGLPTPHPSDSESEELDLLPTKKPYEEDLNRVSIFSTILKTPIFKTIIYA
jgi:hypothetical protein